MTPASKGVAVFAASVISAGLAACGGGGGDGSKPTFKGATRTYASQKLGVSFRYPADWVAKGDLAGGQLILMKAGDPTTMCTVGPTPSPAVATQEEREASGRALLLQRDHPEEAKNGEPRSEEGANTTGAGYVLPLAGGTGSVHRAVFEAGGSGVGFLCSAFKDFAAAEHDIFEPMFASLRVRRDPAAEKVQRLLVHTDGAVTSSATTNKPRITGYVVVRPGRRLVESSVAGAQAVAKAFPGREVWVSATYADGGTSLARWSPTAKSGVVEGLDGSVAGRFTLDAGP